jgi:cytochrome c oxidase subunit 2
VGLFCLFSATGCDDRPVAAKSGQALFDYCAQCHGEDGTGQRALAVPAIAGLPAWYVERQLLNFRKGIRGAHPADAAGLRMRPMSRMLADEQEVQAVAGYVASLPGVIQETTLDGDAGRGAVLYAPCIACHGPDGKGKRELNSPDLTHASDWYLLEQLHKFKQGLRGADPRDVTGAQMRAMVGNLPDERAMRDVIAYIRTLPSSPSGASGP